MGVGACPQVPLAIHASKNFFPPQLKILYATLHIATVYILLQAMCLRLFT